MFTQKLQNPFLKPNPYFSTNNYNAYSYAPPLPPTSKYSAYPAYESSNLARFDSYTNNVERVPEISQPTRSYASIDIDDILRNNPFNRPSNPIFNTSSANSFSPTKYDSTKNVQNNRTNSYQSKQFSDGYSNNRRNYAINEGVTNQNSQTRLTPKKYDNYLSTSSAESATTYINKIYELDDDRSDVSGPITNPFHRKNLIQEKKYEREAKPTNSYDNAAIKYIAGQRQYQKPKYLQNNFLKQEYPAFQSKIKSNQYVPLTKDYSDLEYKRQNYGSNKDQHKPNSFKGYQNYKNNDLYQREKYQNLQTGYGGKHQIEGKYDSKYQDKQNDNYRENNYNTYDKYQDLPKQNFGSKKNIQRHQYNQDKLYSKKYDNLNKDLQRSDSKFDFQQGQHKKSKKFIKAEIKDQFPFNDRQQQSKYGKYKENHQNYKYSFKRESGEHLDRDIAKQSKKSQQRVNFGDSDNSYEQSKHRNKQYPGAFQTLGGLQPHKYNGEIYHRQNQVLSKKLISSQVEQFQSKQKNHQKSLQKRDTSKFGYYEQQQEQDYEHQLKSKKGPVRDTSENYPSTLYYKGMVFSRVQVK